MRKTTASKYHNSSLHTKILVWMLVIALIPLIFISSFTLLRINTIESNRYKIVTGNILEMVQNDIRDNIDAFRLACIRLTIDPTLTDLLPDQQFDGELSQNQYQIQKLLYSFTTSAHCDSAAIVSSPESYVAVAGSDRFWSSILENADTWMNRLQENDLACFWGEPVLCSGRWVLPYLRLIYSPQTRKPLGFLIANYACQNFYTVSENRFIGRDTSALDVLLENDAFCISSWKTSCIGQRISSVLSSESPAVSISVDNDRTMSFSCYYDQTKCLVVSYQNPGVSNWKYYAVISYDTINKSGQSLFDITVAILIAAMIGIIIVSYSVASGITRPLRYLTEQMKRIMSSDDPVITKPPLYNDEVGILWSHFIKMTDRLRKSKHDSEVALRQNQRLELEALRAQINPHFLYNTFSSIIYLMENEQTEDAETMLLSLSSMLHISINKTVEYITVEQEIEFTRKYLDIQKYRYCSRFAYSFEIDPAILQLRVIKILLQPAVENILEHGVSKIPEGSGSCVSILVRGYIDGAYLIFEICDNAGKLSRERAELINNRLQTGNMEAPTGHGIGLMNVHSRIRYEFPDDTRVGVVLLSEKGISITRIVTKSEMYTG